MSALRSRNGGTTTRCTPMRSTCGPVVVMVVGVVAGVQPDDLGAVARSVLESFEQAGQRQRGALVERLEVAQHERPGDVELLLHSSQPDAGPVDLGEGGVEDAQRRRPAGELVHGAGEVQLPAPGLTDQENRFVGAGSPLEEVERVQPAAAAATDSSPSLPPSRRGAAPTAASRPSRQHWGRARRSPRAPHPRRRGVGTSR